MPIVSRKDEGDRTLKSLMIQEANYGRAGHERRSADLGKIVVADLSSKEKGLWSLLGWQQDAWNRNEAPASTNKVWKNLNYQEQRAATDLGFTEDIWNNFEDE